MGELAMADVTGPALIATLQRQANMRRGDPCWLVRQQTAFHLAYLACKCASHSCAGCATLLRHLSALDELVAPIVAREPERCERESARATALWNREHQVEQATRECVAAGHAPDKADCTICQRRRRQSEE